MTRKMFSLAAMASLFTFHMTEEVGAAEPVAVNFDKMHNEDTFKFRFKKDKVGVQRPSFEIKGFVPSEEGIAAILLAGGKQLTLLKDAIYDVVRSAIGADVADDERFGQATYDAVWQKKYTWQAIAEIDRADRRANAIAPEVWQAFVADYVEVMPAVTNKSAEACTNATIVYLKKFSLVRTDKSTIGKLKQQLALYMEHSPKAEEFTEILELLVRKADMYLEADDFSAVLSNL